MSQKDIITTTTNGQNNMTMIHTIRLTLFHVSKQVKEDPDGIAITRIVTNSLVDGCSPETFWTTMMTTSNPSSLNNSKTEVEKIQKSVLRYLRSKDKYGSLGSVLLKSQAFHITHNSRRWLIASSPTTPPSAPTPAPAASSDQERLQERLPIVELPRTKYNKPFIPIKIGNRKPGNIKEENIFPLSVSHQFPFVGVARLECEETINFPVSSSTTTTTNSSSSTSFENLKWRPKIGMDIVAFDKLNSRLYKTEQDFINVFRSNFTPWEWSRIHAKHASSHVYELYIRWSMKEAYTKALGIGMGLEFNSFDMRTSIDENDLQEQKGLWSYIQQHIHNGIHVLGSIVYRGSIRVPETWEFFFLPLPTPSEEEKDHITTPDHDPVLQLLGCACICMEHHSDKARSKSLQCQTKIEWTELESILQWHHP